ncbi:hypothetical protein ACL07V_04700 [Streptomyces sp. MB22_4]
MREVTERLGNIAQLIQTADAEAPLYEALGVTVVCVSQLAQLAQAA